MKKAMAFLLLSVFLSACRESGPTAEEIDASAFWRVAHTLLMPPLSADGWSKEFQILTKDGRHVVQQYSLGHWEDSRYSMAKYGDCKYGYHIKDLNEDHVFDFNQIDVKSAQESLDNSGIKSITYKVGDEFLVIRMPDKGMYIPWYAGKDFVITFKQAETSEKNIEEWKDTLQFFSSIGCLKPTNL